jgi:alkanesulfonate monooxygenase SsuD/methylene tetrahydromethanopterin reductase-like flavin-dependent oxidoreductase (luciferase family)/predicted kinase
VLEPRSPTPAAPSIPDPAVVVLVGASGSGKSTWAAERFRAVEIVASDDLRGIVGSGPGDQEASGDAFALLDQIVAARTSRRLTTVIDTTGLQRDRRLRYLAAARQAQLPAVLVVVEAEPAVARARNASRDRRVPAPVLTSQLAQLALVTEQVPQEGWDLIVRVRSESTPPADSAGPSAPPRPAAPGPSRSSRFRVVLQVSRFPWGADPASWLKEVALTADRIGFDGIALMDHLIQIPQVGRAWEPIPSPWVTLGLLAGLGTNLRLGSLVSPVTLHRPGVLAKTVATLDALSGGRAFCGLGAGWWEREHQAYGVPFPSARERLDLLESTIETMRALWAPGTKAHAGPRVSLPETTCYPRPVGRIPILVGGSGELRTLKIAAQLADGCNLPSSETGLAGKVEVLQRHCAAAGRDPAEVEVTVLDVPVIGRDRDDTAARVERLRGRTPAATFAERHHAGAEDSHRQRYARLAEAGVSTVFLALPDLSGPEDLLRCRGLVEATRSW